MCHVLHVLLERFWSGLLVSESLMGVLGPALVVYFVFAFLGNGAKSLGVVQCLFSGCIYQPLFGAWRRYRWSLWVQLCGQPQCSCCPWCMWPCISKRVCELLGCWGGLGCCRCCQLLCIDFGLFLSLVLRILGAWELVLCTPFERGRSRSPGASHAPFG